MNFKKSFTLSEIMIAMMIFGIIAAACIPIVMNMSPNKYAIMIKKAYYTIEQIVSDLVNDEINFPNGDLSDTTEIQVRNPSGGESITTSDHKFNCLFASKLNLDITKNTLLNICKDTYSDYTDYLAYTTNGLVFHLGNCPINENWNLCRIDVSTVSDDIANTKYKYDAAQTECIPNGNGWGNNICESATSNREHLIAKFAVFITKDGGISLSGTGFTNGQPIIQNIINGTTKLIGK